MGGGDGSPRPWDLGRDPASVHQTHASSALADGSAESVLLMHDPAVTQRSCAQDVRHAHTIGA
jgi:hypothetical protein